MVYNTVFKDLITLYPTWDELQTYLQSEQGGNFRIITKKNELCLIRYHKGFSRMDLPHSKWFRSVVWNMETNRPVSVAPPKVSTSDIPFKTMQEMSENGILCQEQLDGFMINCFRKAGDEVLHITSRSKLDAAGHFYSSKSFRTLFIESYMKVISENNSDIETLMQTNGTDMESPDLSKHEIAVCYSFLVQHVAHRIVTPIYENKVYLVHKCIMYDDGTMQINDIDPICRGQVSIPYISWNHDSAVRPEIQYVFHDSEVVQWIKQLFQTKSWDFQGIVCKDKIGNRWRFRNDKYSMIKSLRGNASTSLERFSQLYTQNLLYQYLQYYPDDNFYFSCYTTFMTMIIDSVYRHYIELFVTKTVHKDDINKMYIPHLYALHTMYITSLRPTHKKVSPPQITCYFHGQPWQRIAFLIKKCQDAYFVQIGEVIENGQ